jgi:hypothetical protein
MSRASKIEQRSRTATVARAIEARPRFWRYSGYAAFGTKPGDRYSTSEKRPDVAKAWYHIHRAVSAALLLAGMRNTRAVTVDIAIRESTWFCDDGLMLPLN